MCTGRQCMYGGVHSTKCRQSCNISVMVVMGDVACAGVSAWHCPASTPSAAYGLLIPALFPTPRLRHDAHATGNFAALESMVIGAALGHARKYTAKYERQRRGTLHVHFFQ